MKNLGRAGLKLLKRHAEAIFIIAFIAADCFAPGWLINAATVVALLYVGVPALATVIKLSPAGRITYLKAFVKTQKVHRLGILLFWIYGLRWLLAAVTDANLHSMDSATPTALPNLSGALFSALQSFGPVAFLASPFFIYAAACLVSIGLRLALKPTKQDPDLIGQRQKWSGLSHVVFLSAFIAAVCSITLNANGPTFMLSNWLLASARDANIFIDPIVPGDAFKDTAPVTEIMAPMLMQADNTGGVAFIQHFDMFIFSAVSIAACLLLLQPALRLNALLTSFCWRVVSPKSLQNVIEAFLEALHLPTRSLSFNEAHPMWTNAGKTLVWLVSIYGFLFWLFGFCGGPLGYAIQSWMIASTIDAGFGPNMAAPQWMFEPSLRIFLGSIVALYGTAPVAITAAVILPCAKPRKVTLNSDGILFAQGPFLTLQGRQFRLWSDLKSMAVKRLKPKKNEPLRAEFTVKFRSGGSIKFNQAQLSAPDLKVLLDSIDQHAFACAVDPEVYAMCKELTDADHSAAASDGITHSSIASSAPQDFKSTIFVPFMPGEFVADTRLRIIKQLASKPLCAVYLARDEDGRMVIVKQFYLAEETDETKALKKILEREYDLLSRLDHAGIAKVVKSFSEDKSTYLVIEHRIGTDLRANVTEHGPRSESLTIAWAKQLCEIMIYLHGREPAVLHRDLTPDNIIAGEDGQLRLIDFGAAREFLDGITGTMIGKHCYVPPEQLRGEATIQSDIYTFGCTLHYLLTGRDPIALSQSSPAKTIDCSEELDQIISDCTEFDQEKRPQSFSEILQRLENLDKGIWLKIPKVKEGVPA